MTNNNSPRSRADNAVLIVVAVLGALAVNYFVSSTKKDLERDAALMTAHVKERQCVLAEAKGRVPALYRCDLPVANEYVDADVLRAEALAQGK